MIFAKHGHESATGACVSPHPKPSSHLSPHAIPLSCSRSLALGALLHASNLHWSSSLHMVIHVFQCYTLKSSHPCILPQSPKAHSLHLCLLYAALHYRIVITIHSVFFKYIFEPVLYLIIFTPHPHVYIVSAFSSLVTTSLFSLSVSLLLFLLCSPVLCIFQISQISDVIQFLSFFV